MIRLLNLVGGMTTLLRVFPPRVAANVAYYAAYIDVRIAEFLGR
jgi:hypothetical protein